MMQGEAPDGVGGIGDGDGWVGCLISSFYIKPQLAVGRYTSVKGCLISSFYIKPQLLQNRSVGWCVVLYLHSTSNHNVTTAKAAA